MKYKTRSLSYVQGKTEDYEKNLRAKEPNGKLQQNPDQGIGILRPGLYVCWTFLYFVKIRAKNIAYTRIS